MSQLATGNLVISGDNIAFTGFDSEGRRISGGGSLMPATPNPGVNCDDAVLTYDNMDTLGGVHKLAGDCDSFVGKEGCQVQFMQAIEEKNPISFSAPCDQIERTDVTGGYFRVD